MRLNASRFDWSCLAQTLVGDNANLFVLFRTHEACLRARFERRPREEENTCDGGTICSPRTHLVVEHPGLEAFRERGGLRQRERVVLLRRFCQDRSRRKQNHNKRVCVCVCLFLHIYTRKRDGCLVGVGVELRGPVSRKIFGRQEGGVEESVRREPWQAGKGRCRATASPRDGKPMSRRSRLCDG